MMTIKITTKGAADRIESFAKDEIVVGRGDDSDLLLTRGSVSKRHARLLLRAGKVMISDLESHNGTHVNGRAIKAPSIVMPGDLIYIGEYVLEVLLEDPNRSGKRKR